jgi:hypothetical protein
MVMWFYSNAYGFCWLCSLLGLIPLLSNGDVILFQSLCVVLQNIVYNIKIKSSSTCFGTPLRLDGVWHKTCINSVEQIKPGTPLPRTQKSTATREDLSQPRTPNNVLSQTLCPLNKCTFSYWCYLTRKIPMHFIWVKCTGGPNSFERIPYLTLF